MTMPAGEESLTCARCLKAPAICICNRVDPVDTRLRVVILQHPSESDADLGTAKLVELTLPRAEIRVGLSWASLAQAVGQATAENGRWAVLAAMKPPAALPPGPAEESGRDRGAQGQAP